MRFSICIPRGIHVLVQTAACRKFPLSPINTDPAEGGLKSKPSEVSPSFLRNRKGHHRSIKELEPQVEAR